MPRAAKTQSTEDRAQELLAGLDKDVDRLQKNVDRSTQAVADLTKTLNDQFQELLAAVQERNWAAGHPAFGEPPILLLVPVLTLPGDGTAGVDVVQEAEEPVVTQVEGEPVSGILLQDEVTRLELGGRLRVEAEQAATEVKADKNAREALAEQAPAKPVESGLIAAKILEANEAAKKVLSVGGVQHKPQADPFADFA